MIPGHEMRLGHRKHLHRFGKGVVVAEVGGDRHGVAAAGMGPCERAGAEIGVELDGGQLGRFDVEFLVDFFTKEIGPVYYNQGLFDAVAMLDKRVDDLRESMLTLEKAVTN